MTPYEHARRFEGIHEDSPAIAEIAALYGKPFNFGDDAWCAVFAIACIRAAGLDPTGITEAAQSVREWKAGQRISKVSDLREGDLAAFWRISPERWEGHAGFVTKATPEAVTLLGGNTSDTVKESTWPAHRFTGGARPPEARMPDVNDEKEHYDRKIFYDLVRESVFGGRMQQSNVDGINAFLAAWEPVPFHDRRWLAYDLATIRRETGDMLPKEEIGMGAGNKYDFVDPQTGHVYFGRGLVQLTWKANYEKATAELNARNLAGREVNLVNHPEQALEPDIAAAVLIYGMAEGWFTGHSLPDYFTQEKSDWVGARRIVNAQDHANEIAADAQAFYMALSRAATAIEPPQPDLPPDAQPSEDGPDPVLAMLKARIKDRTGAREIHLIL